jgi:signal peptidase II
VKPALTTVVLVLVADQLLKLWVKLNFFYDSAIPLAGDWAFLHFIENRGMAFGMEFGGEWGKLALSLLRMVAVAGIGYALVRMVKRGHPTLNIVTVALIFSGALGNIIDSTFYGLIFSESTPFQKAVLFPEGGGYASLLHGAVVDMFYFPLWNGMLPQWVPVWGGDHFIFFRPVFNVADAAITTGVIFFILFVKKAEEAPAPTDRVPTAEDGLTPDPHPQAEERL